jgi:hypothetical protein
MDNLQQILRIFENQKDSGYDKVDWVIKNSLVTVGSRNLTIKNEQITLIFDENGQFEGIGNFKY